MPPEDRYALAQMRIARGGDEPCQALLRVVIQAGLEAMGWPQHRRIIGYSEYVQECTKNNTVNEFIGSR